jgi:hypothetical protein
MSSFAMSFSLISAIENGGVKGIEDNRILRKHDRV